MRIVISIISVTVLAIPVFAQEYSTPGTVKWSYKIKIKPQAISSPAIGADGTIYFGPGDSYLYALNPDGILKGRYFTTVQAGSSPVIGTDGTVYFGCSHYLCAFSSTGEPKWDYKTAFWVRSSPAIGEDGTIYFGSNDGSFYALGSTGERKWRYWIGNMVMSSPAIGEDGTIYFGSQDGRLYALGPDGKLKWRYETGNRVSSSPAIGEDGTIYFGSEDYYFYALSSTGELKWTYLTGSSVSSSPAIGEDGTIYFGSEDYYFYALSSTGELKWRYETGNRVRSSPAIGAGGTIYFGSQDGRLYALGPDGKLKWTYKTEAQVVSSPAIGADGTIYFGSEDHYFYALNGEDKGLVSSPWPMFRQNSRHTGRVSEIVLAQAPKERPKYPADLVISNIRFFEPSGNQALDGYETAELRFTIDNLGRGEAVNVKVGLVPLLGGNKLSFDQKTEVGIIEAGSSVSVIIPITAPHDVVSELVKFRVEIPEESGNDADPFIYSFETRTYQPPQLEVTDVGIDDDKEGDSVGDNDGIVEPGESIEITCAIQNTGFGAAEDVKAKMIIGAEDVYYMGKEQYNLGDIPSGDYKTLEFYFWIPKKYSEDDVPMSVQLTEARGRYGVTKPLNLPVGKPSGYVKEITVARKEIEKPKEMREVQLSVDVDEIPQISLTKLGTGLCIIFGIEDYKYAPKASFANRDAAIFYEYAKSVFGIPERNIYIRTNEGATKGEFDKVFAYDGWLAKRIENGKSDIVFYFSGHGAPDVKTKKPYLVPWDIDPNYASTAFPLDKVYESLSGLGARSVTIFLDACFSGESKGEMIFADVKPLMPVQIEAPSTNITVFTASTGEQMSSVYSEKKHGLFTYYLLKGLQGHGDLNGDKEIRVGELSDYLTANVSKEAGFMDREQVPQLLSGDRERVLVRMR